MPPEGYRSVSLPSGLLQEAERLLKELEREGFQPHTSISDFVKDAIRRRIEELRHIYFIGGAAES